MNKVPSYLENALLQTSTGVSQIGNYIYGKRINGTKFTSRPEEYQIEVKYYSKISKKFVKLRTKLFREENQGPRIRRIGLVPIEST